MTVGRRPRTPTAMMPIRLGPWGRRLVDLAALGVVLLIVGSLSLAPRWSARRESPTPAIRLTLTDGRQIALAKPGRRPIFIDFWTSWCQPCRDSLPRVEAFARAHPDVMVVAVDVGEPPPLAERAVRELHLRAVAFDPQTRIADAFGVDAYPTIVAIDGGQIRARWVGATSSLDELLDAERVRLRDAIGAARVTTR